MATGSRLVGGKKFETPENAGSGSAVAEVEKKIQIVKDGNGVDRTINEDVTDDVLEAVGKIDGYKDGELVTARKEGKIVAFWSAAKITNKAKKVAKGGRRAYVRLECRNARGMQILSKGIIDVQPKAAKGTKQASSACDCFNYGFDLERRVPVRQALEATLAGPEKAVKKMVQGLQAAEMPESEIRAFVLKTPKFKGVEGIERLIDSALSSK